jgi:hypothetical protein
MAVDCWEENRLYVTSSAASYWLSVLPVDLCVCAGRGGHRRSSDPRGSDLRDEKRFVSYSSKRPTTRVLPTPIPFQLVADVRVVSGFWSHIVRYESISLMVPLPLSLTGSLVAKHKISTSTVVYDIPKSSCRCMHIIYATGTVLVPPVRHLQAPSTLHTTYY